VIHLSVQEKSVVTRPEKQNGPPTATHTSPSLLSIRYYQSSAEVSAFDELSLLCECPPLPCESPSLEDALVSDSALLPLPPLDEPRLSVL
jgi:hypothetical protein